MYKERIKNIIKPAAILLIAGMLYAIFYGITGIGIPCIFRQITGFKCPGCGISHMFMDIFRFDFNSAFKHNPVIFSLMPLWIVAISYQTVHYIKTGDKKFNRPINGLVWISIIALIIFAIIRNII